MQRWLNKIFGDKGERRAVRYLKAAGYRILGTQVQNPFGELDIIALDRRCIVFVEVKTRKSAAAGQPFEAVDTRKQRQITRAATAWLKAKKRMQQSTRFDVISILWQENSEPEIRHFQHAFEAIDS